jgi:hypothetical protein
MDAAAVPVEKAAVTFQAPDQGASQACPAGMTVHAENNTTHKPTSFIGDPLSSRSIMRPGKWQNKRQHLSVTAAFCVVANDRFRRIPAVLLIALERLVRNGSAMPRWRLRTIPGKIIL